ncbi:zinc-binding dehydrogenase [Streptomyces sp. DG2A-72]|uniref:zinc-binding dehydrogenase n=1 Tax=Streptomyces sp. DG2A-72 TaxID=3051386 RepID=UPI00265BBEB3|nr:zinc-binding dehydrogenase [Streptomyces sp. DG2A-72]MDO0933729.1 zinc-binding dehydrogenase [Streptomyces sp. DG2A-72]
MGASDVLPRGGDLVAAVRGKHPGGVDAFVDAVTTYEITPFAGVVKDGGRIASPTYAAGHGPGRTDVVHGSCRETLGRVARHLADGTITIPFGRTYAPADAATALQALATRHTRGTIALSIA